MIRGKGVSAVDDSQSESPSDQDDYKKLPMMKKRTTVFQNIKQKDGPSQSNSDYENENFYSEPEEYQDDDDFSLPPGHFQNQPSKNPAYSSIQELKEMKYKEKQDKSEQQKKPEKSEVETAANPTTSSKKRKKNKKKTVEEEKTLSTEETPQSKLENQKSAHLKKQFLKRVNDLQSMSQTLVKERDQIK